MTGCIYLKNSDEGLVTMVERNTEKKHIIKRKEKAWRRIQRRLDKKCVWGGKECEDAFFRNGVKTIRAQSKDKIDQWQNEKIE